MISTLATVLERHLSAPRAPLFGAVAGVWRRGELVDYAALGWANAYALDSSSGPVVLETADRTPVARDTRFDIASLTKLFTATAAMMLVDDGVLDLDAPIAASLPEFVEAARGHVSLRQLLTHTAALPEDHPLWDLPIAQRLSVTLTLPTTGEVGAFSYSCVGYIAVGTVLERVTGQSLAELLSARIFEPLALNSTGFGAVAGTSAATEYEPWAGRPLLRGEVHDEMAWALGGAAGNAGLFSTLDDIGRFANSFITGQLLSPSALHEMFTPTTVGTGFGQAVGFRVDAPAFMGALSSPDTIGHTGFTGTSVVIDRAHQITAVLLSNRVHPSRDGADSTALRVDVAAEAARLL